jgi:hypothetical protein
MFARMCGNKEPSYTVAGNIDSHYGKQYRGSSKNLKRTAICFTSATSRDKSRRM